MKKRKIRDAADARSCMEAAARLGLEPTAWARSMGIDGRSLRAWSINLGRGAASRRSSPARSGFTKRVELIELVPTQSSRGGARYVVRVGRHSVEVYRFEAELVDHETLKVRGYMGIRLFGANQTWKRYHARQRAAKQHSDRPRKPSGTKDCRQTTSGTRLGLMISDSSCWMWVGCRTISRAPRASSA